MAERVKVDFESGESLLLFRLHLAMAKKEPLDTSLRALASELNLPGQFVRVCAERLDGNSLCKITKDENWGEHPVSGVMAKYDVEYLEIKELGIQEVQSWSDEKYRKVAKESKILLPEWEFDEALNEKGDAQDSLIATELHGSEQYTRQQSAPASDRIVTFDHNSTDYKEAVGAVDAVIDAVVGDNEYGNESPEEKEAVVAALKAGRVLLDAEEVSESALTAFLVSALQYVAKNFTKGAIAALGAAAVAKVLGLF